MSTESAAHEHVVTIRPAPRWSLVNMRELWDYRELLGFLTWREITVRYRQTILGAAWAIIQPVFTVAIFATVFGRLAGLDSEGRPYVVFAFAALLPWQLFANSVTACTNSVVGNQQLITKIYFPRILIPLSSVLSSVVDFCIGLAVLMIMLAWFGLVPSLSHALWCIPLLAMAMMTSLGVGLWLAALNVHYRDVRHGVPFLMQIWMYASPVAYSTRLVPEQWRALYALNPMVVVLDGFRAALLSTEGSGVGAGILVAAITAVVLFVTGVVFFRSAERTFADRI